MFDQFMVGAFVPHYITAIGAEEIFEYPVWGRLIRRYGAIPIKRKRLKSALKSFDNVEMAMSFCLEDVAEAHLQQSRIAKSWLNLFE